MKACGHRLRWGFQVRIERLVILRMYLLGFTNTMSLRPKLDMR
jgi:hypothetical protein